MSHNKREKEFTENEATNEEVNEEIKGEETVAENEEVTETVEENKTTDEHAEAVAGMKKIEELEAEVAKYKDLYIRAQAEMENLRRRTQNELISRTKFAITDFAKDILSVADNLTRAMSAMPKKEDADENVKNIIIGLEMTQKELENSLSRNGVTPIESVGKVFNPNWHKVVQEIQDETKPNGTITQEWQKGYLIGGDRVLREAVVIVTKGGPKENADSKSHIDTTA
ncbi:MAG: nucleotide exchange factor GrpE [Alphaproteobacteria bacterium]|nr:nucleotide exchange factor GrpE [Alphaproteobacteria bacterium]